MVGITNNYIPLSTAESSANVDSLFNQARKLSEVATKANHKFMCFCLFSRTISPVDGDLNGMSLNNIIDRARRKCFTHDNRTLLTDTYSCPYVQCADLNGKITRNFSDGGT
ncbi:hypothetical protein ACLED0_09865 [Lonsdalea quercina]|uniref:hypothetical protein n=1 Tax=Lonsdalea quercina TaxID=71657 RepID=UPI0039769E19